MIYNQILEVMKFLFSIWKILKKDVFHQNRIVFLNLLVNGRNKKQNIPVLKSISNDQLLQRNSL